MRPATLCQHSAPRRALNKTTLHQIRLDHLLQSIAAFRKRRAQGFYAHRPARIMFGHQHQVAPIRAIKAHIIHAKAMQRMIQLDPVPRADEALTPLGRMLVRMPVDAQIGKMLVFGCLLRCLSPCLTIAAALSGRPPFLSPSDKREEANAELAREVGME